MNRWSVIGAWMVFIGLIGGLTLPTRAQPALSMNASLPYGAVFPPQTWIPLQMDFVNHTDKDIQGRGIWPVNSPTAPVDFALPVVVPAHSRLRTWIYGYVPSQAPDGKEWKDVKSGAPLATLEWRNADGARLARVPVLGIASWASGKHATGDVTRPGWIFLAINSIGQQLPNQPPRADDAAQTPAAQDADSIQGLANQIAQWIDQPIMAASVAAQWAPRDDSGYIACKFILLDRGNPDHLDALQRQALLAFVRAGGNLIVSSPSADDHLSESWIAPYLPVRLIGHRLADEIQPTDGKTPLKLLGYVPVAEAVPLADPKGAHVVLRDRNYVHAAWRKLGRGRVLFTSFPIAGLNAQDKRTRTIWEHLLHIEQPATRWQTTRLQDQRVSLTAARLGKPTASWFAAAVVAGGFLLLVLVAQLAFAGARRPTAFTISVIVAVVLSVALVGWTMIRTGRQTLMGSSLAVMDIGPDGGGQQREVTAYVGKNLDQFSITAAQPGVMIRPIVSAASDRPTVLQRPFRIPSAQVQALRVQRVWQADGMAPADLKASATAQFDENGLNLTIDNQTGQTLASPVWVWNKAIFSLNDLPAGQTTVRPNRRNGLGDYTNAAVIRSQLAQWRGDVVSAFHRPNALTSIGRNVGIDPQIDAWLSDPPTLTKSDARMRRQAVVRLPVHIKPSPSGSIINIDRAYTQMVTGRTGVAQYDPATGQWLQTNLDATLLIGFAAPRQLGRLTPQQVYIDLDINAPQQTLTIQRGQTRNGKVLPNGNPAGPTIGQWTHPVERHQVDFTAEPGDYDAQGRIWLRVHVQSPPATGGNVISQWQFRYLEAGFTAKVK